MKTRNAVVALARSWIGKKESNGTHREIIDIYNTHKPLPRNAKMQYNYAWCAATWSALAIKLGYTDIMPVEMSCGYLIEEAKKMGIWVENDGYIPQPGDAILYDWNDNGVGDNISWPSHVGVVEAVNESAGYFTVIEGNYSDSVKRRTVSIDGRYIRGFITPKYDPDDSVYIPNDGTLDLKTIAHQVICGQWGVGQKRRDALTSSGYDYDKVQALVNDILNGDAAKPSTPNQSQDQPVEKNVHTTCFAKSRSDKITGKYVSTTDVYCRNDAGSNKKALCIIPKGNEVWCHGYYTTFNGADWYLISFTMDGVSYTGFTHSKYLEHAKSAWK